MAEPVRVRRLTDQEGQRLQQIVRRGSTSSVRYRRAMMLLASAGGNRVPVIAQLVQADEDTVRDVIHRFNEIGLACLDPRWAGGRPRLLSTDDEDFVIQTATTRPAKLGQPFTRPTYASWANPIEAHFGPLRQFTIANSNTRTTPSRPGPCTPTCGGATPTPATATSWPPNARNAPASEAREASAGADAPSLPRPEQPGEPMRSEH
ncbi:transposase [Streptomyces sp. SPB162]|nr:transposase [Streptomyces sp. SPB162]